MESNTSPTSKISAVMSIEFYQRVKFHRAILVFFKLLFQEAKYRPAYIHFSGQAKQIYKMTHFVWTYFSLMMLMVLSFIAFEANVISYKLVIVMILMVPLSWCFGRWTFDVWVNKKYQKSNKKVQKYLEPVGIFSKRCMFSIFLAIFAQILLSIGSTLSMTSYLLLDVVLPILVCIIKWEELSRKKELRSKVLYMFKTFGLDLILCLVLPTIVSWILFRKGFQIIPIYLNAIGFLVFFYRWKILSKRFSAIQSTFRAY